ncbi:hypothetical protein JMUB5056_1491 [Leptotrichia hongkongensis]|uniref:Uncharacterized protein n=1 Tax=Leptotrichia hongkongensis TaxID=554406 RepID=A0A510L7C0_9FUSO|nr:hypothetical protein JMUB5056_1491 [Leptotrichia hongkongensis]
MFYFQILSIMKKIKDRKCLKFFEIINGKEINIKFRKQIKSNDILKIIKDIIK